MKRRDFLKGALGVAVATALPGAVMAAVSPGRQWGLGIVSRPGVKQAQQLTNEHIRAAVEAMDKANVPTVGRFVGRWNKGALETWYIDHYGKPSRLIQ